MLTTLSDLLKRARLHEVAERHWLDLLVQPESLLDLHLDPKDKTGRAEATKGGEEEVGVFRARADEDGSVGHHEGKGKDAGGDDLEVDAGAMSGGGDDAADGLILWEQKRGNEIGELAHRRGRERGKVRCSPRSSQRCS
jgi:hypothetical protein